MPLEPRRQIVRARGSDIVLMQMEFDGPTGAFAEVVRVADEPDVLFLTQGHGRPAHGKMAGSRFYVPPSQSVRTTFVPYGADSSVVFAANAKVSALLLPPLHLASLAKEQRPGAIAPVLFSEDERLRHLAALMEKEILTPGMASDLLLDGLSRAAAALLARLDASRIGNEADRIHLAPHKLRRVQDFIEANLAADIGLAKLAALADLSPFHFSRVFRLAVGVSPYRYLKDRRLARSRLLLADGELDIASIAAACGFANQSHFTAAFTKSSGLTPARYRRQCQ